MTQYDTFISYASEDNELAAEIAGALKSKGFRVWYAPFALNVGDSILESIERGLRESNSGVLILSPHFFRKGWTRHELDTLIRDRIEHNKPVFPIWHGVKQSDVAAYSPGLAGIVALRADSIPRFNLIEQLARRIPNSAGTLAAVPGWEDPCFRFLRGRGELTVGEEGGAFTIWEALYYFADEQYPIRVGSTLLHKDTLLYAAAEALATQSQYAFLGLGEEIIEGVRQKCIDAGIDPKLFG